jgi:hypothetical protein
VDEFVFVQDRGVDDSDLTVRFSGAPRRTTSIGGVFRVHPVVGRGEDFLWRDPQPRADSLHPALAILGRPLADFLIRCIGQNLALDLHGWQVLGWLGLATHQQQSTDLHDSASKPVIARCKRRHG